MWSMQMCSHSPAQTAAEQLMSSCLRKPAASSLISSRRMYKLLVLTNVRQGLAQLLEAALALLQCNVQLLTGKQLHQAALVLRSPFCTTAWSTWHDKVVHQIC